MFHPDGPTFFELAQQALSSTTKGYDLLADKFEHTPFRTPDPLLVPLADEISAQPVGTALDLCCGNGALARAIKDHVSDQIVGIDLSEGMLEDGRKRVAELDGCEIIFEQQDAFTMTYNEQFDAVVTAGAFGHVLEPDQQNFALRVWRALKPGGRFVFITSVKPKKSDPAWWMARGFNAAMHVRNAVKKPPFIMFYLTFTLERACDVLGSQGFTIEVSAPYTSPFENARLVTATKPL